jgi:7-carboxy-7-deazaguanine synthase
MVINEIFYSLQGEGLLAGTPSVFIRLAGCPLHCQWCDTKYASDPNAGDDLSIPQIIDNVKKWDCKFIVITGGEPMVNDQLPQLAAALKEQGKHITIETAGIAFIDNIACDLMSISPKLSNSGIKKVPLRPRSPDNDIRGQAGRADNNFSLSRLINCYPYQLKFVVDSADDLPEIQKVIASLGGVDPSRVMLMPQAGTRDELIAKSPLVAQLCKQTGFLFCHRLQILLYEGAKGK